MVAVCLLPAQTPLLISRITVIDATGVVEKPGMRDMHAHRAVAAANPLHDIRDSARVRAAVLKGEWLDRRVVDAMLARARQ